jgi:hypothetical protein
VSASSVSFAQEAYRGLLDVRRWANVPYQGQMGGG